MLVVEDIALFRMVRTDPSEITPPFTTERVDGIFPRLTVTNSWATMIVLFDEYGYILDMKVI